MEQGADWEIRRIPLPAHQSDFRGQSRAFFHFRARVLAHVAAREYELVYATSSRLMTAALGAWIARRKRALLYLDIRDIFVDTIRYLSPPLAAVARAVLSPGSSPGLSACGSRKPRVAGIRTSTFAARYGERSFAWFTNGIDDEFLAAAPAGRRLRPSRRATAPDVLYAGNIGAGQGLHEILPALARALRGRARFVVIGDGGRRGRSSEAAARRRVPTTSSCVPPMPREQLIEAYRAADVLLLHLGRQAAFERVLPSKLFEYAALGKPMLAGVGGYAARFIARGDRQCRGVRARRCRGGRAGVRVADTWATGRARLLSPAYARAHIARAMADDVLAVLPAARR